MHTYTFLLPAGPNKIHTKYWRLCPHPRFFEAFRLWSLWPWSGITKTWENWTPHPLCSDTILQSPALSISANPVSLFPWMGLALSQQIYNLLLIYKNLLLQILVCLFASGSLDTDLVYKMYWTADVAASLFSAWDKRIIKNIIHILTLLLRTVPFVVKTK